MPDNGQQFKQNQTEILFLGRKYNKTKACMNNARQMDIHRFGLGHGLANMQSDFPVHPQSSAPLYSDAIQSDLRSRAAK